eukprot:Nk52_evm23s348 gene=Nk52_evmTU23s348
MYEIIATGNGKITQFFCTNSDRADELDMDDNFHGSCDEHDASNYDDVDMLLQSITLDDESQVRNDVDDDVLEELALVRRAQSFIDPLEEESQEEREGQSLKRPVARYKMKCWVC